MTGHFFTEIPMSLDANDLPSTSLSTQKYVVALAQAANAEQAANRVIM